MVLAVVGLDFDCLVGEFAPKVFFFFFNDTATTEIYTLSLHDALPISHISLRQRPAFYNAHFSLGIAPLFILPISHCGSTRAFYTYQFLFRQRPRFFY